MLSIHMTECHSALKRRKLENSLLVKCLGLGALTAKSQSSIPAQETMIPQAPSWPKGKKKKEGNSDTWYSMDES